MAKCPDCGALIDIDEDEVEQGEVISCPDCAVDLEIVNTHPLEFDVLEEEDEEEDDEEGDEAEEKEDEDLEEEEESDEDSDGFH